ncbi:MULTISPECIES: TIGR01777 family oxidoreductase [unclassified Bacillus (in: firmicutes)]|uniref:TIGR01777 family oxidoreductase n=1 Tax=unclassified Bacillus (in: firmicutes) TaxID=185979 RepID=UPI0008F31056|nr:MULTISPECIES: TIGR01777 family oxidoreductase [unclassified Bacillus (in: firmicutes)]SFB09929.1 hypothetical protein SAMN02799634_105309 [Bacillus sp. UNCCL13]SFQ86484.1 hypothetical protein SAMN04488577_2811 [Bacillus sp. cl95]
MKIAIAGGTGFVGRALTEELLNKGHEVFVLTRTVKKTSQEMLHYVQWLSSQSMPEKDLDGLDAFINLAGESINSGRWTESRKERILKSRLEATQEALRIIDRLNHKPSVLINASAIGIYGTSLSKTFTENDISYGQDFLASTVAAWESSALEAKHHGVRVVLCRFGIILDSTEGALPRIALPYRLFAGGTVGNGQQWLSWIHLKDVLRGIQYAIEKNELHGPVNFTAPQPVRMKEFGRILGKVLNRPHWIPAPGFALKLLLGEMSLLVLEGQEVLPEKLLLHDFRFEYPTLPPALKNIFS